MRRLPERYAQSPSKRGTASHGLELLFQLLRRCVVQHEAQLREHAICDFSPVHLCHLLLCHHCICVLELPTLAMFGESDFVPVKLPST